MMKWKKDFSRIFIEHFWGIVTSAIFVLSLVFILLFGVGPFVLLVVFGLIGFLIGDSIDRGIPLLKSFKDFLNSVKRFLISLAGKKDGNS